MSEQVNFRLKRQKRKSLSLHILDDASVEVRAPKWVPDSTINRFVEKRTAWVLEQQQLMRDRLESQPQFCDGESHWFKGEQVQFAVSESKKSAVSLSGNVVNLSLKQPDQPDQVERLWLKWCKEQALELFAERMQFWLTKMPAGTREPTMKLRLMKRRWGSCNSRAVITLNTRLIHLPVECIDYVIVHELCHLWELNHSSAFYQLLASILPDWQELEQKINHY